jgi:cell division protein ZapA
MRRLKIKFLNVEYIIKTDADEEYVRQIASFLEEKVKEISKEEGTVAVPRSFLLAMLKITDDYFKLGRDFDEFKDASEQRSQRLVQILEGSLKDNDPFSFHEGIQREELRPEELEDTFKYR